MAVATGADIIQATEAASLTGLMLERVRRSAERVAYVQCDPASGRWIESSWRRVAAVAVRWQAALRREGLKPGDRVSLQMGNRLEWVYFDMAALGLGLVTVPLYTNDRPENVRHILEDAGVRLLLLESSEQLEVLAPVVTRVAQLRRILVLAHQDQEDTLVPCTAVENWLDDTEGELDDLVQDPNDLATIVYTSGTTGAPKGVMLSHHNILWNAEASLRCIPAYPQDRFLSFLPLSHMLERTGGYYLPMMAGSSVAFARSIPQLAEDLQIIRPTVMVGVPRIFERIHAKIRAELADKPVPVCMLFDAALKAGWRRFEHAQGRRTRTASLLLFPALDRLVGRKIRAHLGGRLRIAVSGGAPISPQIIRFFVSLGVPVVQGYGLTEASPVVSVCPLESNLPGTVGIPLPGTEIRIGPQDELLVKSPGIMQGYWCQPQATRDIVDADGWLRTGDQARMDGSHIVITGRLKEVIVLSNGEKVAPADLEMAIMMDSLFSQVLIIGEGHPYLSALVVLDPTAYARLAGREDLDPDPGAARLDLRLEKILVARVGELLDSFPGYAKVPRLAVVDKPWTIDDDLLTPTLKLKRTHILQQYRQEVEHLYEGHR